MNKIVIILTALVLMGSTLACCCTFPATININGGPSVKIGDLQKDEKSIPLGETTSATVDVLFGAGELEMSAGDTDDLFLGTFLYNVDEWEPQVSYEDGKLIVQQGYDEESWGWPGDEGVRNEWDLRFSPEVVLDIDIRAGAGQGELNLTGLQIEELDVDLGAGDFTLSFDEPNTAEMSRLTLDAGATRLEINGVGNASPEEMVVQGSAGEIVLDLTGDWTRSADIEVTAGLGQLNLLLPDDVGVKVDVTGGLANIETYGLRRSGGAYVNDAYGEAETELTIAVTTGVGQVDLEVVD
ncbi:MAG: hypothetical protein JXA14_02100 [Anaerolineae bacterium]|nr:hypothetical protein [Anaerolineae bacterium]